MTAELELAARVVALAVEYRRAELGDVGDARALLIVQDGLAAAYHRAMAWSGLTDEALRGVLSRERKLAES